MERLQKFFSSNFMAPHGFCFLWLPEIVWMHVAANAMIAAAYFSIPLALWHFTRKRPDIPFSKVFILFASFITLCGITHIFGIIVLWYPIYGIEALVMLATGIVSAITAYVVWKIIPLALKLPSPTELLEVNKKLNQSYEEIENKVKERTVDLEIVNNELTKAIQKAESASQAKSDFLTNMSHEIRTPMNVVIGLAHILEKSSPLTPKQQECINTLKISADSLLNLISDLLDVSKIEENNIELEKIPFSLFKVLSEVTDMMSVRAKEKALDFGFTCDNKSIETAMFAGDPKRIQQILINLCGNAVKFTEKGSVSINVQSLQTSQPDVEEIIIEVSDTGIGIAQDKLTAVFYKFTQADSSINRKYGGTGLGLSITKRLAELMGGSIEVRSKENSGTVFTVAFPLKIIDHSLLIAENSPSNPDITKTGSVVRVLLVEDYAPNVMVATYSLEQLNYEYDIATNGEQAINKYKAGKYDIVIMDVQMPVMDGIEATSRIRAYERENNLKPVKIIGMTAHALVGDKEKCLAAGMNNYLSKPYNFEDLVSLIKL